MAKQNSNKNRSYELKKLKAECVAEENKKYLTSQQFRKSGSQAVEPGNKGLKVTTSEVFVYIAGSNAEEVKNLQEQFKTTRNFKKTKAFTSVSAVTDYIRNSKLPNNSIVLMFYVEDINADKESQQKELSDIEALKAIDPTLDAFLVTSDAYASSGACDFVVAKNSEMFGKIITNITWAIREQDRIRKQVESKQFIKIAIITFFVFFIVLFSVDFITGLMDDNPNPSGIFGIVPIPHE